MLCCLVQSLTILNSLANAHTDYDLLEPWQGKRVLATQRTLQLGDDPRFIFN
jgi:hypothetical protein